MTWVGVAVAGATVIGGAISASGAESAASTQAAGQEQAAATQAGMFNTIVGQEQPFLSAGKNASYVLSGLLGANPDVNLGQTSPGTNLPVGYLTQTFNPTESQLENYPGYQFQLKQGDLALESKNAPSVGALSGTALKQLMGFNQGLAASNYNEYFDQFQTQQNNIFNRLSGLAALGQNAAGNLGNNGAQLGAGIASAQAAAAGSEAAGTVGAANAMSGAISNGIPLAYMMSQGTGSGGFNFNEGETDDAIQGALGADGVVT